MSEKVYSDKHSKEIHFKGVSVMNYFLPNQSSIPLMKVRG
jgi:hypothetical protein